jgi:3-oxoacyl-(acyl-carrier-protein) synthase
VLGEGAAVLMLEDAETAAVRNARILGYLRGHGERFDPSRGRQDGLAVAAARGAMVLALADAGLGPQEVQCVSASARGEVTGDRREALALRAVFAGRADDLAVTSIKAVVGEALGVSGPLQVVALVEAMRRGTVPGIPGLEQVEEPFLRNKASPCNRTRDVRNGLVNSFGFDGNCCAVVVTAP